MFVGFFILIWLMASIGVTVSVTDFYRARNEYDMANDTRIGGGPYYSYAYKEYVRRLRLSLPTAIISGYIWLSIFIVTMDK